MKEPIMNMKNIFEYGLFILICITIFLGIISCPAWQFNDPDDIFLTPFLISMLLLLGSIVIGMAYIELIADD